MDRDFVEKLKSQIAKEETSSIVESEDGVAKIHIGSGDVYKNFIEVNENDDKNFIEINENEQPSDASAPEEEAEGSTNNSKEEHRKISGTMTPTIVEVYGRD